GQGGVGGPLPQVAGRRALQVPPRPEPEHRHAGEARKRGEWVDPPRRGDSEHRRDRRDRRLRDGEPDGAGERVDVGRRARHQVAGAGALHRRERQGEHAAHEVFPQLREHLLGQDERRAAREPRQRRLREQERKQDEPRTVDVAARRPAADSLHEVPEDRRPCEARRGSTRMQPDRPDELAAMTPGERASLAAELGAVRDRQQRHSSSPLVTTSRYGALVRSSSRWVPSAATRPSWSSTTRSARSSTSGLVVTTAVVRPARASRSRLAIRASVCASTALVGSTSTRISASLSSARASTRRWRWPPENERPRSSTSPSRPPGSAATMSSAFATATAARSSSSDAARGHGSSSARSLPANRIGSGSLTTIRRLSTATGSASSRTPPSVARLSPNPPRRSATAAASPGDSATRQRSSPGRTTTAESGSSSGTPCGGSAAGERGSTDSRSTVRIASIRRAPTRARVILSTASADVLSGMTRNAA